MLVWNLWHGCKKFSPGCLNCYVYRRDVEFGKDSSIVTKTGQFYKPIMKNRKGIYKIQPEEGAIYTCMSSDFFLEEADEWRREAWSIIRERSDLQFIIVTKRIHRFFVSLPEDWKEGYKNVSIMCTCENQETADYRIPILLKLPIQHRLLIHEPMLEAIQIDSYLESGKIESVTCGGESGQGARLCDFAWILNTRDQCIKYKVPFYFKQTGALFQKDGHIYHIDRKDQMAQAAKAGINYGHEWKHMKDSSIIEEHKNDS